MTQTSLPALIIFELCMIPCMTHSSKLEAPVLIWPLHRDIGALELIHQTYGEMGDQIYLHEGAGPFPFQKPYMLYGTENSYFELTVPESTSLDNDISIRFYVFPLTDSGAIFHYAAATETFDIVAYLSSGILSFILRVGLYYTLLPSHTEIPKYQWSLLTVAYQHNRILVNLNESEDVERVSIPFHAGHIPVPGVANIGKGDIAGTATTLPHFFGSFTCLQIIPGDESFLSSSYDDYCSGNGLGNTTSTTDTATTLTTTTNKPTTTTTSTTSSATTSATISTTTSTTTTTTTNKPTTTTTTTYPTTSTITTTTTKRPSTTSTRTTISISTPTKPQTTSTRTTFLTAFTTTPTTNKPTTTSTTTSSTTSTTTSAALTSSFAQTSPTTTVLTPYTSSSVTSATISRTTISKGTSPPTTITSTIPLTSSARHTSANKPVTASSASVSKSSTVSIIPYSVANSSPLKPNITASATAMPSNLSPTVNHYNLTSRKSTNSQSMSTSQPTTVSQVTPEHLRSNGTENNLKLVPGIYITESDVTITPTCKKFRKYSNGVTITSSDALMSK